MADSKEYLCALHSSIKCGCRGFVEYHHCDLHEHSPFAACPHRMQSLILRESMAEKIVADEIKTICDLDILNSKGY
jgi:hypothetical protein